jgi:hypothetical protein
MALSAEDLSALATATAKAIAAVQADERVSPIERMARGYRETEAEVAERKEKKRRRQRGESA